MTSARDIIEQVTCAKLADALGVKPNAIYNAGSKGRFPPRWFLVVRDLCAEHGLDAPPQLFGMVLNEVPCLPHQTDTQSATKQGPDDRKSNGAGTEINTNRGDAA